MPMTMQNFKNTYMKKYVEHFAEIKTDYTDDQNLLHIDVYKTANDNEQGRTIAVVDMDTKKVIFFDNLYRGHEQIQEAINEVLSD